MLGWILGKQLSVSMVRHSTRLPGEVEEQVRQTSVRGGLSRFDSASVQQDELDDFSKFLPALHYYEEFKKELCISVAIMIEPCRLHPSRLCYKLYIQIE